MENQNSKFAEDNSFLQFFFLGLIDFNIAESVSEISLRSLKDSSKS